MGAKAGEHTYALLFLWPSCLSRHHVSRMSAADMRVIQVSACLTRQYACSVGLAVAGMHVKLSGCCRWAALERSTHGRMWSWAPSLGKAPLGRSTVASGMALQSL